MRCLIVGCAKSGTTALLALIGQALDAPRLFVEEPLAQVVPALQAQPGDGVAKVLFGHEPEDAIGQAAEAFDRRVLLLRDPRDLLVSSVLYVVASRAASLGDEGFLEHFADRLRAKQADPMGVDFVDLARLFDTAEGAFIDRLLRRQAAFARFAAEAGAAWHVVRYEDVVAGRLEALGEYLGRPLCAGVDVPADYARVARTKSAGDWRHWFTPRDVAVLRPACDPVLESLGYPVEWTPAPQPWIAPEHSWGYVDRLVEERRRHYGLAPRQPFGAAETAPCNLCGGTVFGPGPAGRMAANGRPPCCEGCGALERQRVVRRLVQTLPADFLAWRQAVQFTRDSGLPETAFRSFDSRSLEAGKPAGWPPHLDGSVDLVAFSHLLEYLPDDLGAFAGLVRLLSAHGLLLAFFAAPLSRPATLEPVEPDDGAAPLRLYGRDLERRLRCAEQGLAVLVVEATDPCTGVREVVHLFFKNGHDAARLRQWLLECDGSLRLRTCTGLPESALPADPPHSPARPVDAGQATGSAPPLPQAPSALPEAEAPAPRAPPATSVEAAPSITPAPVATSAGGAIPEPTEGAAFDALHEEFGHWQQAGRRCPLWWRDDDLSADSPALRTLAAMAERNGVPILVAVIPGGASATLAKDTAAMSLLSFCQHGLHHCNHEAAGEPPSEFGAARPLAARAADLREGHERMLALFGARLAPVFVPPWNRLLPDALPFLKALGLRGVSLYHDQPVPPEAALPAVNTHLDILQWSPEPPVVCQPTALLVRQLVAHLRQARAAAAPAMPLGILTHHRPMLQDAWTFMQRLIDASRDYDCVRWMSAAELFPGRDPESPFDMPAGASGT